MQMRNKQAFTMIELVFVIVVLGILAGIAIPRFAATRTDAVIAKGRSDVASIRSGIVSERQSRLLTGNATFITDANLDAGGLFGGVLMYPLTNQNASGNWFTNVLGNGNYNYIVGSTSVVFDYNNTSGTFSCDTGNAGYGAICAQLIN